MNNNVKKIFEILGVEPNEEITISTELPLKEIKEQLYFGEWEKVDNKGCESK